MIENLTAHLDRFGLTHTQKEVTTLVAKGYSNREIAVTLFITEKTVKTHLVKIYEAMNVKGRAGLVVNCLPYMAFGGPDERDQSTP